MSPCLVRFLSFFIISRKKRKLFRQRHSSLVTRYRHYHKKFDVGIGSYLGEDCHIAHKETTIGKFCSIAQGVHIGTTSHLLDFLSTHPFQYQSFCGLPAEIPEEKRLAYRNSIPCHIGNDVWIGLHAVIMDGITVGDGAVIASHAVVTKDVPPYAIVGGVPARIIKYRFPEETASQLLELKWWDLPMAQIQELPFNDIHACIQQIRKIRTQENGSHS